MLVQGSGMSGDLAKSITEASRQAVIVLSGKH